jgi:predicted NAD-dependent protein-ADP-ribosyltransferase YbiA (DUF1768 family)
MKTAIALLLVLSLAACASEPATDDSAARKHVYPDRWWTPLPPGEKPYSWEITPDKAAAGEVILSKRTELGVFSNLGATPFELDGKRYASIEGLWQSLWYPEGPEDPRAKAAEWPLTREQVEQLVGFAAKRAGDDAKRAMAGHGFMSYQGRRFDPHGSAEDQAFHRELIERATSAKVEQNPEVKALLVATGDLALRPDHDQGKNATPAYRYHEILMRIREALRRRKP